MPRAELFVLGLSFFGFLKRTGRHFARFGSNSSLSVNDNGPDGRFGGSVLIPSGRHDAGEL
jgi:hypothetical protein